MLTILRPPTVDIGVWHDRTALPSRCTVHAPQNPAPQPNFVPVRPSSSRRYQSSGMSGSPSNDRLDPLIVNVTMELILCVAFACAHALRSFAASAREIPLLLERQYVVARLSSS